MAGALTGSLEALGEEQIDGVAVRGYRANFDLEKMLTDTRRVDRRSTTVSSLSEATSAYRAKAPSARKADRDDFFGKS